jgi:hypothetical protein
MIDLLVLELHDLGPSAPKLTPANLYEFTKFRIAFFGQPERDPRFFCSSIQCCPELTHRDTSSASGLDALLSKKGRAP